MKLATRIILLISLITLLMGMLTIIFSAPVIKQGFRTMDHEWTKSLTGALSEGIANDTINGNASRVRQIIEAVVLKNKELEYAYVVNFEQHLFAHTFKKGFPKKLFDIATNSTVPNHNRRGEMRSKNNSNNDDVHLRILQIDGKKIEDISFPIIEGMSARLHLGLSEESDVALLKEINQKFIMIIFTLGLVGIAIAFPLSRQLTKPLERFDNLMQDYGSNKVKEQIEFPEGSVEIITLGKTFNQMIKDRALVDKALKQFKGTLDQTLDCVFMFDAEKLNFFYVNEGALQQVGYSYDELQTMHDYDIKPEFSEQKFHELIAPLISGEKRSLNFETEHEHKSGQRIPVEIFLQYIAPKDEAARFVAIVRDITERKLSEAELTKHRENLEELVNERTKELNETQDELVRKERLATLGQLTATVSHELRNPLGAIRPSLYVIQKLSDQQDERLQNSIERIDRNVDRCDRIIDEMLDFTRVVEPNKEWIKLDKLLESILDEQTIPKGILLTKSFNLKDIKVNVDSERLRRAIINIFENGCHAMMDDDGQLVNNKDSCLTIKTTKTDKRIEIIMGDTGKGIAPDMIEKIFEPLFSTKGFGVGLGMSIVKQIMEQHGGGIEIESEEGKCSRVTLWLPFHVFKDELKGVVA